MKLAKLVQLCTYLKQNLESQDDFISSLLRPRRRDDIIWLGFLRAETVRYIFSRLCLSLVRENSVED